MADKVKEHKVPKINTIIVYPVTQNLLSGCLKRFLSMQTYGLLVGWKPTL